MKKTIAAILSFCFVLSISGCKKESEKTKKTKDTDVTEKSTEEPSTTTTEPSETEPSETEPMDFGTGYFPDGYGAAAYATGTCDYISVNTLGIQTMYGARDVTDDLNRSKCVYLDADYIVLFTDEYNALAKNIYGYETERYSALEEQYLSCVDDFISKEKKGEELSNSHFEERYRLFRADSEYTCFAALTDIDGSTGLVKTFNYDSQTGELITLSDVITSKDALSEYVEVLFGNEYYEDTLNNEKMDDILAWIEEDTLPFCLVYDGIVIPLAEEDWGSYFDDSDAHMRYEYIKIPITPESDVFNMTYFDTVPEEYMLMMNGDDSILWDFDDDGKLDVLNVGAVYEDEEEQTLRSIAVQYNNTLDEFTANDSEVYSYSFVVKVDGNWYLHIACEGEASYWLTTYVYRLTSSGPQYCSYYTGLLDYDNYMAPIAPSFMDPSCVYLYNSETYWATLFEMYNICSFESDGSMTPHYGDYGVYSGQGTPLLTTKIEITGTEIDIWSREELGSKTVPSDTTFTVVETMASLKDPDPYVILKAVARDEEDTFYIKLDLTTEDYKYYLNDIEVHDMFYYVLLGD